MNTQETAGALTCHPRYVRYLINQGKLAARNLGSPRRIVWDVPESEVERFRQLPASALRGQKRRPRNP